MSLRGDRVAPLPVADNSFLHPLKVLSIVDMRHDIDIGRADRNDIKKRRQLLLSSQREMSMPEPRGNAALRRWLHVAATCEPIPETKS